MRGLGAASHSCRRAGTWPSKDAFTLPYGAIALAAVDVVGHDLETAVGMARLRNMLHS
ncbi:hypothetical protein [Streptomyces collinus]|uniref:hypothetical protein n=1 Tax=Streptomyces collinus TaxID=42684 RepID=UPI0034195273